mmetsp:Transcript_51359/g.81856  ORF Transcript_51359/g.81856 Transcript_51359/m.81856 type:complete len:235 (+) Transcript_51359:159-863(+)
MKQKLSTLRHRRSMKTTKAVTTKTKPLHPPLHSKQTCPLSSVVCPQPFVFWLASQSPYLSATRSANKEQQPVPLKTMTAKAKTMRSPHQRESLLISNTYRQRQHRRTLRSLLYRLNWRTPDESKKIAKARHLKIQKRNKCGSNRNHRRRTERNIERSTPITTMRSPFQTHAHGMLLYIQKQQVHRHILSTQIESKELTITHHQMMRIRKRKKCGSSRNLQTPHQQTKKIRRTPV